MFWRTKRLAQKINDARLDIRLGHRVYSSQLRTRFRTLAQAAGSTGVLRWRRNQPEFFRRRRRRCHGRRRRSGLLPIIQRRLSRRGAIEVDGRSNTLIVTDVRENIEAIRQLIAIMDQPEPQVEIETRIVIASRNFSRDLGFQLSAAVANLGTGGLGSFSTLPSGGTTGTGTTGTNPAARPFGIPGGISGGAVPNGSLGGAANTVIGLTTGIFGTAQISA